MKYLRRTIQLSDRAKGPVFADSEGFVWTSIMINEMLHEALEEIYGTNKSLFPFVIKTVDDVQLHYGIYRSFRRGSDSRAIGQGVSELDILVINRWSKRNKAKGSKVSERMELHYADQDLLDNCFKRYTFVM